MNEALFNVLSWINSWIGSWGWSMVVFTILIRLVLTPLDYRSRKSMRKTQALQPKLQEIQKKYANDKEKQNQKTAELYKKAGVNPMSSCLPLLLTWPLLIIVFNAMRLAANYQILGQVTQILNNEAPTLEKWLWVKNLWMPDSLFAASMPDLNTLRQIPADLWQNWFKGLESVPVLIQELGLTAESFTQDNLTATIQSLYTQMSQNPLYLEAIAPKPGWTFNLMVTQLTVMNQYNGLMLLPILSSVSQFIMTKVTGGANQNQGNDQAAQTGKFMNWFFPIFSLVLCFSYSSAFALYWVVGNISSLIQTIVLNKIIDNQEAKAATVVAGEGTVK